MDIDVSGSYPRDKLSDFIRSEYYGDGPFCPGISGHGGRVPWLKAFLDLYNPSSKLKNDSWELGAWYVNPSIRDVPFQVLEIAPDNRAYLTPWPNNGVFSPITFSESYKRVHGPTPIGVKPKALQLEATTSVGEIIEESRDTQILSGPAMPNPISRREAECHKRSDRRKKMLRDL